MTIRCRPRWIAGGCDCRAALAVLGTQGNAGVNRAGKGTTTELPAPIPVGNVSLEESIAQRRSVRECTNARLTLEQISQLCWAGQGIAAQSQGFRSAPSAGALFPIELYVVTADGADHYRPVGHKLERHLAGDLRPALQRAALDQEAIGEAPVCVVIAGGGPHLAPAPLRPDRPNTEARPPPAWHRHGRADVSAAWT